MAWTGVLARLWQGEADSSCVHSVHVWVEEPEVGHQRVLRRIASVIDGTGLAVEAGRRRNLTIGVDGGVALLVENIALGGSTAAAMQGHAAVEGSTLDPGGDEHATAITLVKTALCAL